MNKVLSILSILAIMVLTNANAQDLKRQYCNPLPMEIGPGGNASGDVTVHIMAAAMALAEKLASAF